MYLARTNAGRRKFLHPEHAEPGRRRNWRFEAGGERKPEDVIRLAVKGMLPKNRLARKQMTKLKIYAGPEHPHQAQQPQPFEIETR